MSKGRYEITSQADVAEIRILGDITWWQNDSETFTRQLRYLKESGIGAISCYLNSGGGSTFDAMEIYNQIKSFPGSRKLKIGAVCCSAATIIAMAFEVDETEIAENCQFMVHNPSTRIEGDEREIESKLQLVKNVRENMVNIYVERTGLSADEISDMMHKETWMTAAIAKQKRFVKNISGKDAELPAISNSAIQAYGYKHVPEVLNSALNPGTPEPVFLHSPPGVGTTALNPVTTDPNPQIMKKLVITALALSGVSSESPDAEVVSSIQTIVNAKQTRIEELEALLKTEQESKVKSFLDGAEQAQKITAEQRKDFEVMALAGQFDTVKSVVDKMTARTKIADVVSQAAGKDKANEGETKEGEKAKPKGQQQIFAKAVQKATGQV